ncbi:MAG: SDR family oxidoreductase [Lachnospiraceae bacterium]|nr:SDR family oxidoreductase [Lachnospiraceae bacterium]
MKDKIVLVIGSTSGIGKAVAESFAKEGATAILTGRREELGKSIETKIREKGQKADFFRLDATDLQQCVSLIDKVVEKYGRLDTLVYNAGVATPCDTDISSEKNWDMVMNTNLKAAYYMIEKALPVLAEGKGSVVMTSSLAGISARTNTNATSIAYATSKAAMSHMVKIIALQTAESGVRVNAVAPGVTMTDIIRNLDKKLLEVLEKSIPLQMIGEPEDIAEAILFLASDKARFITGQILSIDGGASLG